MAFIPSYWTVVVKNNDSTSDFTIEDLSIVITSDSTSTLTDQFSYDEICGSKDLKIAANNDFLVINDGTSDLSKTDGIKFIALQNVKDLEDNYYNQTYLDVELDLKIGGSTGAVTNAILIADGVSGKTLKAAINSTIDSDGQMAIGSLSAGAMLDITCRDSSVKGLSIEAASGQTANLFEINSNGGSGGDLLTLISSGYLGINNLIPSKHLDVNGDAQIIGDFQVGSSYWSKVGNTLWISGCGVPALAALNSTDVAFIDYTNDTLRTCRFDGTSWYTTGNTLLISGIGVPALAALNGTDVAFIDLTQDTLKTYRFDGTDWSQVGNGLVISGNVLPALAALNGTDVAFVDSSNRQLRTYRFDGTDWSQVGNGLGVGNIGLPALAALNGTDVAIIGSTMDILKTYRFDGTDWSQVGNGLFLYSTGTPTLTALDNTDVALIDSTQQTLKKYRFDGTNWSQVGLGLTISGTVVSALAALNGTDVAFIDSGNDLLTTYRFNSVTSFLASDGKVGIGTESLTSTANIRGYDGIDILNILSYSGNSVLKLKENGYLGVGELEPEYLVELTSTAPCITFHNSTEEDSNGGRESKLIFKGEQSGGEETTLAIIQAAHDGMFDNQKGFYSISTNRGTDGNNPTESVRIDSRGYVGINTTDADAMVDIICNNSAIPGLIVEAASSQTVDLLNINSNGGSGGDLLCFDKDGYLGLGITPAAQLHTTKGRIVGTTRITDSTATLDADDHVVFVNTDNNDVLILLPPGVEGTSYRIINCGSSGNDITVVGSGAETIWGDTDITLADGDIIDLVYNTIEDWW